MNLIDLAIAESIGSGGSDSNVLILYGFILNDHEHNGVLIVRKSPDYVRNQFESGRQIIIMANEGSYAGQPSRSFFVTAISGYSANKIVILGTGRKSGSSTYEILCWANNATVTNQLEFSLPNPIQ